MNLGIVCPEFGKPYISTEIKFLQFPRDIEELMCDDSMLIPELRQNGLVSLNVINAFTYHLLLPLPSFLLLQDIRRNLYRRYQPRVRTAALPSVRLRPCLQAGICKS